MFPESKWYALSILQAEVWLTTFASPGSHLDSTLPQTSPIYAGVNWETTECINSLVHLSFGTQLAFIAMKSNLQKCCHDGVGQLDRLTNDICPQLQITPCTVVNILQNLINATGGKHTSIKFLGDCLKVNIKIWAHFAQKQFQHGCCRCTVHSLWTFYQTKKHCNKVLQENWILHTW